MKDSYATLHFARADETAVEISNRTMVVLGDNHHRATLSDVGPEGVADLIARMFEALASAPDLTDDERTMVRSRMAEALESVAPAQPVAFLMCCKQVGQVICVREDGHDGHCGNARTLVPEYEQVRERTMREDRVRGEVTA